LRRASRQDAGAIRRLIRRVGINPLGLNWRRFLIAVDSGGRLVGCGQVKPHNDGTRELASIAVEPDWRGRGIAREIIETLMAENPPPLYLTCRADLEPLYNRFGFRVLQPGEMERDLRRIWRMVRLARRVIPGMPQILVMGKFR
jgi:GNAT superfamily N-acetyltransferase